MRALPILLISLGLAGCCSMEKCEQKVGECEKQVESEPVEPRTIYIKMPAITIPEPVVLKCESWTDEMIMEDPVGYEETLYADILMLVDRDLNLTDYLERLEAARQRREAKAEGAND
jgi:hypothetical protein